MNIFNFFPSNTYRDKTIFAQVEFENFVNFYQPTQHSMHSEFQQSRRNFVSYPAEKGVIITLSKQDRLRSWIANKTITKFHCFKNIEHKIICFKDFQPRLQLFLNFN